MTTLIQETYTKAVSKTCANCPYFQDFGEANGRGWCGAFDQMARSYHERTGACDTEIEALEKEAQQQPAPEPEAQLQPPGLAGDSVTCQLQPTKETTTEFEQGRIHGRNDAEAGWHPIYKEPATEYALGYLSGYNGVLNPTTQPHFISAPQEWSVSYDSKWDWYRAYVGSRCIGHGTTHQEAERIAQQYVGLNSVIRRQNAAVMAAYAS